MDELLEAFKDRGVMCGKTGAARSVLTMMPPLTVSREQIAQCLAVMNEVCDDCPDA
jgi:4-aminobutyrate aminotransferase-like enzyme